MALLVVTFYRVLMWDTRERVMILLLIEGLLLCAFLAMYDYAPEANASIRENSVALHLNGKSSSLSVSYMRKFCIAAVISHHFLSSVILILFVCYRFIFLMYSAFFVYMPMIKRFLEHNEKLT